MSLKKTFYETVKIRLREFEGVTVPWNTRFFNGPQWMSMQIASIGKRDRGGEYVAPWRAFI